MVSMVALVLSVKLSSLSSKLIMLNNHHMTNALIFNWIYIILLKVCSQDGSSLSYPLL